MTTTYSKSLSVDFSNNLKVGQFNAEIYNDAGIPETVCINTGGDVVDIVFSALLSGPEETVLNSLISSHVPVADPPTTLEDLETRVAALEVFHP